MPRLKRRCPLWIPLLPCLFAAPLCAQPQIGGGTCSTLSLNKTYMMTMTGRQIGALTAYSNVFQADGSATFDGQSKVTFTLTQNTVKGVAAPQTYSGTYVVQANCLGSVIINTGDNATFNLMIYNQGSDFLLAGTDSTYNFTGSGSAASANACTVAKLAGVYSLNATGYSINNSAVNGVVDGVGLIQFDGKGAVTVNFNESTEAGVTSPLAMTGTYTIGSSCLGTASLSDSKGNSYSLAIAATSVSGVSVNGFNITIGQTGKVTMLGAGHPLFGQPTALLLLPELHCPGALLEDAKGERA
jgi:hypothetical protein